VKRLTRPRRTTFLPMRPVRTVLVSEASFGRLRSEAYTCGFLGSDADEPASPGRHEMRVALLLLLIVVA
jgi:hypothetical protein